MRERLQGLWRRFRGAVVLGLICAAFLAMIGRGGLLWSVGVIYLIGLLLAIALILYGVSVVRKQGSSRTSGTLAIVGTLLLASLPLGASLNKWDVSRAKAWCEQNAEELGRLAVDERGAEMAKRGAPMLASMYMEGAECHVADRTRLWGEWVYTPENGWERWD